MWLEGGLSGQVYPEDIPMKAAVPAPEAASTSTQQAAGFFMFYCKAKKETNKKTNCVFTLSLLWLPELECLLTRRVQADTRGPLF